MTSENFTEMLLNRLEIRAKQTQRMQNEIDGLNALIRELRAEDAKRQAANRQALQKIFEIMHERVGYAITTYDRNMTQVSITRLTASLNTSPFMLETSPGWLAEVAAQIKLILEE